MIESDINFADGLAYERMMGVWSRLVGEVFLDWLSPQPGQRWIDVGCGNGAFTELLAERSHPTEILGIDPSAGLLNFARKRHARNIAHFELGDAMALPGEDDGFDAAAMALVIFFVADPVTGVAEMNRVVRPGGTVSAYVWDILEPGGFPMAALQRELSHRNITTMLPLRADVSSIPALRSLWNDAGLTDVSTREITVTRTFSDFEDYWASVDTALGMSQPTEELSPDMKSSIKNSLRASMPVDAAGHLRFSSRANAITGKVNSK